MLLLLWIVAVSATPSRRMLLEVDRNEAFPGYSEDKPCRDDLTACHGWAMGGECERNPGFMAEKCQMSCKVGACLVRPGFQEPALPEPARKISNRHRGYCTEDGTRLFIRGVETEKVGSGFFRRDTAMGEYFTPGQRVRGYPWLHLSSIGMGTYLGAEDQRTDDMVARAVVESVRAGVNVLDTAINYRNMRGEKALGVALRYVVGEQIALRPGVFISTKAGFFPYGVDVGCRRGARDEEVNGHTMHPKCLKDMISLSLANIGVDTVDLLYLHNPAEMQLPTVGRAEFMARLRRAFMHLEQERRDLRIRAYGLATWNCFRVPRNHPEYLSLWEVVLLAEEVGGKEHGFRYVQMPLNAGMLEAHTGTWQSAPVLDVSNSERESGLSVLEAAGRLSVGVFASGPLGEGGLLNSPVAALVESAPELEDVDDKGAKLLQVARSAPGVISSLVGHKRTYNYRMNLKLVAIPPMQEEDFEAFAQRAAASSG